MSRWSALLGIVLAVLCLPAGAAAEGDGVVSATVIAVAGATVEIQPIDRPLTAGSPFNVEARITAEETGLALLVLQSPGDLLLRGLPFELVSLRAGRTAIARWSACAPELGAYIVLASLYSGAADPIDSGAETFTVSGKRAKACPRPWR